MNTDARDLQRVNFAESRSQKREDVEELEANAEKQHLDAPTSAKPDGESSTEGKQGKYVCSIFE